MEGVKHSERRAGPIPFIIKTQNDSVTKYRVTQEAETFLSRIQQPFSIITVTGLYRTGKSYLLNRIILNREQGFNVGSTVNACTKGLWLWGEVLRTNSGNLLVIDTEGLGALDEEANHDMKIICLAVLLSTTFIYNSQGSIDENALQTLSLVLNLVNHIDQQSVRPDFIWVVRDFALQLIDSHGKSITPQQYLELALKPSDFNMTGQKLQIRNTILNAFKDRDCFTLVKPIIDENKLQRLDEIPMENLRGQFIQQSLSLRKKIMTELKPITFNGKQSIKGIDYLRMAQKYTDAFNEGKLPCMLDTWTYIKEAKARQAIDQIQNKYTEKIKNKIMAKLPLSSSELQESLENLKTEVLNQFFRLTYEQTSTEQIEKIILIFWQQLKRQNSQMAKLAINTLLNTQFQSIHKKLFAEEYQKFDDYRETMNSFRSRFMERYGQKYDSVDQMLQNFVQLKTIDGYSWFDKHNQNQILKLKQLLKETQEQTEQELQESSQLASEQKDKLQSIISALQKEKYRLEKQNKQLDANFQQHRIRNSKISQQIQQKNEQLMQMVQKLTKQISQKNCQHSQTSKATYIKDKELQRDRAVFIQKQKQLLEQISQLESQLQQTQRRLKLESDKVELEKKELTSNLQHRIIVLTQENKDYSSKVAELELENTEINSDLRSVKKELHKVSQLMQVQSENYKAQLQKSQINQQSSSLAATLEQKLYSKQEQIASLKGELKDLQNRNKELEDQFKNIRSNGQKELAIYTQKIQFQQMELSDLKGRNEQLKKNYHQALENIQENSKHMHDSMQVKIFSQKNQYENTLKMMEAEYNEKMKTAERQYQALAKSKEEIQFQLTMQKKTLENKEKQWREANNSLQELCQKMEQKLVSAERGHQDLFKEKENYFRLRVKQLEQEVEEIKERTSQQIRDSQTRSQEALALLKKYSETERMSWQKRLNDEKERGEKKLKALTQELELKMNEEKQLLEDQNAQLQQKLMQTEKSLNLAIQNLKYDFEINLQKAVNKHMDERVQLTKRTALIEQELTLTKRNLEKQLEDLKVNGNKQIEQTKRNLTIEYQQMLARVRDDKETIQSKYDSLKKCNKLTEQDNLKLKNQIEKEKAVYRERQYSYQRKLEELEEKLKSQLETYNITIEQIKNANDIERRKLNEQIESTKERNMKLDEECNLLRQDKESQKSMLETKIGYLETSLRRSKEDYEDILHKFELTVKHLSNRNSNESNLEATTHNDTIMKMKEGYERALDEQKTRNCRIMKDYQEKLSRLSTQNKALKDKLLMHQIRPNDHRRLAKDSEVEKVKLIFQQRANEYVQKIKKLQEALTGQKKQHQQTMKDLQVLERINMQKSYHADSNKSYHGESNYNNEKSERSSLSGYSANTVNHRYQLTDNKNVTNVMNRKSSQGPLIPKGRVIDQDDEFTGIRKYNKY